MIIFAIVTGIKGILLGLAGLIRTGEVEKKTDAALDKAAETQELILLQGQMNQICSEIMLIQVDVMPLNKAQKKQALQVLFNSYTRLSKEFRNKLTHRHVS